MIWTEHCDEDDMNLLMQFHILFQKIYFIINIQVIQFNFAYNLHDQVYSPSAFLFWYLGDPVLPGMFD